MREKGREGKKKGKEAETSEHDQRDERVGGEKKKEAEAGVRESRGITLGITERRKLSLIYHLHIVQRALA